MKTDAEAAIKGKQWMLSSYGPFKDKPSLPNFEDQSFEEIRSLCYDAKNKGNLQALLPQLTQRNADASYKISMLCDVNNVNNNLLTTLVSLYNSGESTGNTQSNSLGSGNPFAISSGVGGGSQTSSLFGANTAQQNPFGNSLFSSNSTPSSSIFGSGNGNTTSSIFGQQQQQNAFGSSGTSVFGGQSAFGGGVAANTNTFGTSSFGQPATNASPFALSQIGQPTDAAKPTSIFGQTQNSIFGAAPAFSNPIQPSKPSGLFGAPNTNSIFGQNQQTPAAASGGLFGQSNNTNQPTNTGNLFSSPFGSSVPQPQTQSIFGAVATENKSIFGQVASNQSMFGTNQQQQQQQQTNQSSNIFASALAQQQNPTQNVFGVQHQPEAPSQQSIFNQSNSNTTSGSSIFQNQANAPAMGGSIFGGGGGGFGQPAVEQINQSAYSKLEDLKPEDLQWFQAENFMLLKIPTVPPPRELCV